MKLIIQPSDGVAPLVSAVRNAKKSVDIVVFRFDHGAMEAALKAAVTRGVKVTALIAWVNRGGVKSLRELEMRFLAAGLTVVRTNDDLIRYHDKFLIIDERVLYMLSFNFTHLDIEHSRGFGIATGHTKWLQAASELFEADRSRKQYTPRLDAFVVSPGNARKSLGSFLKRAKKQLLIYDPKISDKEMLRILRERARAGVEIRVIGRVAGKLDLEVKKLGAMRLHTRTIIRDAHQAFIGSQSLRAAELDSRRELGLIIRGSRIVKKLMATFESDWRRSGAAEQVEGVKEEPRKLEKQDVEEAAEMLAKQLKPLKATLKKTVKKVVAGAGEVLLEEKTVKDTVKKVVKKAVKEAVQEVAQETNA